MHRLAPAFGWCLLALFIGGCAGEKTGTITGTVTFKGTPLAEGMVSFVMEDGKVFTGTLQSGEYLVARVPVGPARLKVVQTGDPFAKKKAVAQAIPLRYRSADESGLRYIVVSGKQTHDLELTEGAGRK